MVIFVSLYLEMRSTYLFCPCTNQQKNKKTGKLKTDRITLSDLPQPELKANILMSISLSILSNAGGSGKTTLSVHLAYSISQLGYSVAAR